MFTQISAWLGGLSSEERLDKLGMCLFEFKEVRGNIIETCNTHQDLGRMDAEKMFPFDSKGGCPLMED